MKRPHEWPCVCQDCCAPWDPRQDPTDSTYVMRRSALAPVDQEMPIDELRREFMAIACRCTGKSEAQVRAMQADMGLVDKQRQHWTEQGERTPGEDDE